MSKQHRTTLYSFLIALCTGVIILAPLFIYYYAAISKLAPPFWFIVISAGFFQAIYFSSLCAAYSRGDLSFIYPLVRSTPPLLVAATTIVIEGPQALSAVAVFGILLVALGGFFLPLRSIKEIKLHHYFNKGAFFALLAGIATTGYSVLDDRGMRFFHTSEAGQHLSPLEVAGAYLFLETFSSIIWLLLFVAWLFIFKSLKKKSSPAASGPSMPVLKAMVMGLGIFLTYSLVLAAMLFAENVSYVVAFRQLGVLFSVLLGIVILKELGNRWKVIGALCMTLGLFLVALG